MYRQNLRMLLEEEAKRIEKLATEYADKAPAWAERFIIVADDYVVYFTPYTENNEHRVRFMFLGTNTPMKTSWKTFSDFYYGDQAFSVQYFMSKKKEEKPKEQKTVALWNGVGEPPIGATVRVVCSDTIETRYYDGVLLYNSKKFLILGDTNGCECVFEKEGTYYTIKIKIKP